MTKKQILIVGGGFAGTKAALTLAKHPGVHVTLLSNHDHFRYYRSLYRVATGRKLAGAHVHLPRMLRETAITFAAGQAARLDRKRARVTTDDGQLFTYDLLVLALGTVTTYFDIPGLDKHAYTIKSTEGAERFRRHLHAQLATHGRPDDTYVVIGGGPTGVELAGALPKYMRHIMKAHGMARKKPHIVLVEAAPRLLPMAPEHVSAAITKRLERLGVTVMVGTTVKGQTATTLSTSDGPLTSNSVVWTAGVANNPFFAANNFTLGNRGRVVVDEHLRAEPNIYVLGDNADTPFSGVAQTALNDGKFVAENILRSLAGKPLATYAPKKPTSIIPVGSKWASVHMGKKHFTGYSGWTIRHMADLTDLLDLQSVPHASKQWVRSVTNEDLRCPDCLQDNL